MKKKIKLPTKYQKFIQPTILAFVTLFVFTSTAYATYAYQKRIAEIQQLETTSSGLQVELENSRESYLIQLEDISLQYEEAKNELNMVSEENITLKGEFTDFNDRAIQYVNTKNRIADYKTKSIDVGTTEEDLQVLYDKLLEENYEEFDSQYEVTDGFLTEKYNVYIAGIAAAQAAAVVAQPVPAPATSYGQYGRNQYSSYEQKNVSTDRGSFWADIVTIDLSNPNLRIITDTADERDNCWAEGCATKSLGAYVSENGGFAGINGSYFCPPDYSDCVDKPGSFDLAAYNSGIKKWVNPYLKYKGLMTFNGRTPSFYYGREDSILQEITVTAGIANHPPLLSNGSYVYSGLDYKQEFIRSYRGGIGYGGGKVYLVVARSATVPDLAYVMKTIGAENALNLDGGGSSALYYDGYKLGPGRLLPNAIVFAE